MSKRYVILALILIALAAGLSILPERPQGGKIMPEELLMKINDPARYLTTDQIAHRLINQDPSFILVDVRPENEYEEFALPNSVNVPLDRLLEEDNRYLIDQYGISAVFYSNSDIDADRAWIIFTRLGIENIYVMKGGVNEWFKTIIEPQEPAETDPTEAFDLYSQRIAASRYFTGGGMPVVKENTKKESILVRPKKKKNVAEGGC